VGSREIVGELRACVGEASEKRDAEDDHPDGAWGFAHFFVEKSGGMVGDDRNFDDFL
jgi:hypothetical protein